jgi:hypothetical protein
MADVAPLSKIPAMIFCVVQSRLRRDRASWLCKDAIAPAGSQKSHAGQIGICAGHRNPSEAYRLICKVFMFFIMFIALLYFVGDFVVAPELMR